MKRLTASTARPNPSPAPPMSVPSMAFTMTVSVSDVRSWSTRTAWPCRPSVQRCSIWTAASVMVWSNFSTSPGRKAGAHMRRCAAHSSPLLVSSPLPRSGRSMSSSGVWSLV